VILSGIIAFLFNVLVFTVVQKMSANHAACAGNFNKAAAIVISIVCGTEIIPPGFWGFIMLFAIAGNMISFTLYSLSTQTSDTMTALKRKPMLKPTMETRTYS